jgi:uncharacterized alkaline shock family protein YloU
LAAGNSVPKDRRMALSTSNKYGNITISDDAVSVIISRVVSECYGVAELVSRRLSDSIITLFNKIPLSKGINVVTMDNCVYADIYVVLKEGVNKEAVLESLKSAVEYHVEHFTGMRVKSVNIHVVGMRL